MIFVRAMVIVLGTFVTLTAFAQTKLSAFVEANGCKLLAAEAAVKRMKEIASQGSVTWDGNCKNGLIDGRGVLRKEGTAIRVEISNDGLYWTPVTVAENVCAPNMPDGWSNIDLPKPVTARHLKIFIFTNCGDAQLLTFRGLRFE